MNFVFRTISDLPGIDEPSMDSYLQVSQPVFTQDDDDYGVKYGSMKVPFKGIVSAIVDQSRINMARELQIPSETRISSDIMVPLNAILTGEATLSGQKAFDVRPTVVQTEISAEENAVATIGDVERIVTSTSFFFQDSSHATASPDNSSGYTKDDGNLLMWNIDSGQRDSSLFVNPETGLQAGYLICPDTGFLVMYGWLADNGNLNPEECWVGLFSEIENEDGKRRATLIQMQPWIIGSRSQTMQYVGFSIPVKKGLKLKVMTGFNVNGENSGFGNANSLMTSGVGSMVNTFVGYIVK